MEHVKDSRGNSNDIRKEKQKTERMAEELPASKDTNRKEEREMHTKRRKSMI